MIGAVLLLAGAALSATAVSQAVPGPQPGLPPPVSTAGPEAPVAANPPDPELSATTEGGPLSKMRVRGLSLNVGNQVDLVVPDGTSRLVVETRISASLVRLGIYYNFVNGQISTWLTYGYEVWAGTQLQVAASDVIGLGRIYSNGRFVERDQTFPVGVSQKVPFGHVLVGLQRTYWQLASLQDGGAASSGRIDAVGLALTGTADLPDVVESLQIQPPRREDSRVRVRHAFTGWGAGYAFDQADADIRVRAPGLRHRDVLLLRGLWGQTWNVHPSLPMREQYGLGGIDALKGYPFGKYHGTGIAVAGGEYSFRLPWTFSIRRFRLGVEGIDILAFGEAGRIQSDWTTGAMPVKWSAGAGFKVAGTLFKRSRSAVRLYAAWPGEHPVKYPMLYAVADIW